MPMHKQTKISQCGAEPRDLFADRPTALKAARQRAGISMSELSRRAGMNPGDVSRIERGRMLPYRSQAEKLAEALGWRGPLESLFAPACGNGPKEL